MVELSEIEQIFCPTESCYLWSGEDAITSFADNTKNDSEDVSPKPHAVVMTQQELQRLCVHEIGEHPDRKRTTLEERVGNRSAASEVLSFINNELASGAIQRDQLYEIGDNFYFVLSSAKNTDEFIQKNSELNDRIKVICRYEGESVANRLKGHNAENAKFDKVDTEIRRAGVVNIEDDQLFSELSAEFYETQNDPERKRIPLNMFSGFVKHFLPNQYFIINMASKHERPMVGYVIGDIHWQIRKGEKEGFNMGNLGVELIPATALMRQRIFNIQPRDLEQALYLHAMSQEHISRIFITGGAGSGKTLMGYASALKQVLCSPKEKGEENLPPDKRSGRILHPHDVNPGRFRQIVITKSNDMIGGLSRDRGWRPGNTREKMDEDIQSYVDAHEKLGIPMEFEGFEVAMFDKDGKPECREVKGSGLYRPSHKVINVQDYATWRGRTFDKSVIFLDEAQNLTPKEFMHLNQRVGLGSLVVISGDYEAQMDNERMSETTNGLFAGIRHYTGERYVAVISLERAYRDLGAEHAGKMKVLR
jgi:hypothetical protein